MVTLLDRIIRGISRAFGIGQTQDVGEEPDLLQEFVGTQSDVPPGDEITSFEFTRKFVSGLFYCGGEKVQWFGLTFEQNDTDRSDALLDAIDEVSGNKCSDIRENFGYESSEVDRSEVRTNAIWPDIEVDVV
jgi:hypothetical protein